MAAAIVSSVRTTSQFGDEGRLSKYLVTWTSATDGSATLSLDLEGWLIKVVTDPGATAPTDNYDITLIDAEGADAALGLLADRDTTNSETVYTFASGAPVPVLVSGTYTWTLAAAGDAKTGTCALYVIDSL